MNRPSFLALTVVLLCVAFLIGVFACGVGLGLVIGEGNGYKRRFAEEKEIVNRLLDSDRAFGSVTIEMSSSGGVWLSGSVHSADELDRLRVELVRMFGERRATEICDAVRVVR